MKNKNSTIPLKVVDSSESKLDEILDEGFRKIIVIRFTNQLLNVFKENTQNY